MYRRKRNHGFTLLEASIVVAVLVTLAALIVLQVDQTKESAENTGTRALWEPMRQAFTGSAMAPGYLADMKHLPGFDATELRVRDLLESSAPPFDPLTQRGWRGPYLSNVQPVHNTDPAKRGFFPAANDRRTPGDPTFFDRGFYKPDGSSPYGDEGDRAVGDLWGNPVVLQVPPGSAFAAPTPEKRFRFARLVSAGPDGILETPLDRLAGMTPSGNTSKRGDDFVLFLKRADIPEDDND